MKYRKKPVVVDAMLNTGSFTIPVRTQHGIADCEPGDWLIKGTHGEVWPCKPDVFAATYEPVMTEDDSDA